MTMMCKIWSIEVNIKLKAEIVNIAKIDVVKPKFHAKKSKSLKLIISLIFQKLVILNVVKKNIIFAIASFLHSLTNRKKKLINVILIASIQNVKNKNALHYFFILMTLSVNIIMITIKTIIDNEIIHNSIFQLKIKKHNFVEIEIQFQKFRCLDDTVLKIYKFHSLNVDVIDQQNVKTRLQ